MGLDYLSRVIFGGTSMRRVFVEDNSNIAEADLGISRDKLIGIIEHARMFDVKEANTDSDSGSNPTDDGMIDVLEDKGTDTVGRELLQLIRDMNVDEQI